MDRIAVFVDAGYLFAQGSALLAGKKRPRSTVSLNHQAAAQALTKHAETVSGLPMLRIYWYDGTSGGPTSEHLTLADLPGVKVRLGLVNSFGEQKGVDSLIVTDMINLARNRAMSDAVLLSGDEDLRVGVQQAQEFGVRVHLLGIKPSRGSQSVLLLQEADTTHEWSAAEVSNFLSLKPELTQNSPAGASPRAASASPPNQHYGAVAEGVAQTVPSSELSALVDAIRQNKPIPFTYDSQLLGKSRAATGGQLDSAQKSQVRDAFRTACERRLQSAQTKI